MEMVTSWDYRLVSLSVAIAILGSYVALDFVGRMKTAKGISRKFCFVAGALTMGLAVWTMHFVGMLALNMNMPVSYDTLLSVLSMMAAAVGAGIAFSIMNRESVGPIHLLSGSIAMGLAIVIMHYMGMASMKMGASVTYNPWIFAASVAIAVVASAAAMWIAFQLRVDNPRVLLYQKIASAVVMGIAISGMHYTGMAAASYQAVSHVAINTEIAATVGIFKLSDILITASVIFAFALVVLSSRSYVENQTTRALNIRIQTLVSRYESMVGHAKDAIISVDGNSMVTRWNKAAEDLFGYSVEEVIGKDIADFVIPPEFRQRHHDGMKHMLMTGEAPLMNQTIEIVAQKRNGEVFPIELVLFQSGIEGQEEYTTFIRDITERKKFEDQLKEANEMLRMKAHQLETVNKELEAFSYSVSHDLRAPLRSIDGFSQALFEDYFDKLDDTAKEYLQFLRSGSQKMAALIDDMLQLSRLTRGELNIENDVNLSAMAQEIAADLKRQEPERRVEFDIDGENLVMGDKRLLQSVLQNLIGNAWKFTSKHPTALIEFKHMMKDGKRVYYVKDDGAGLDMAYANKLFSAFQRLHGVTEFPGTGIGLASVARIVHRHGGEVWVEGAVEKGATFYFTLE